MQRDDVPQEKKDKLIFVQKVLEFAMQNGLDPDGSYQHYVHTDKPVVSYLVYAAHKDKFKLKKRWFPFVGSVPYLGFFHKEDRNEKADDLAEDGYDVYRTGASAFSLLGWFDDPIYAPMLKHSEVDLAHILFHELTHKTFWAPSKVKFNENLAEFVAMHLTQRFVAAQHTKEEYDQYLQKRADRRLYKAWLKSLRQAMKSFYKEHKNTELGALLVARKKLIRSYVHDKLPAFKTQSFAFIKRKKWNNASILAASIYSPDVELFEAAHVCLKKPQMGMFLAELKKAMKKNKDGIESLKAFCTTNP